MVKILADASKEIHSDESTDTTTTSDLSDDPGDKLDCLNTGKGGKQLTDAVSMSSDFCHAPDQNKMNKSNTCEGSDHSKSDLSSSESSQAELIEVLASVDGKFIYNDGKCKFEAEVCNKKREIASERDEKERAAHSCQKSNMMGSVEDDEENDFVLELIENLIEKREWKTNEARLRWLQFKREQVELMELQKQFEAYWSRRHREDRDLWRDKDFANAVDKMSRAGYKGEHGSYHVPSAIIRDLDALYMQITVGDYDGNNLLKFAENWQILKGKTKIDCQRDFIKLANKTITKYGWNPPDGWR